MSYTLTPDWTALPAALLPTAKKHCRADDFTDDDAILTAYLSFTISYFEKAFGSQIFGAAVAWTPEPAGLARYQCPVQPVSGFTVMSGGIDVSSEYALEKRDPVMPVWLVHADGTPFPADASVTLTAGYADASTIEPSVLGDIMRITAKLYEYRESVSELSLGDVPVWMNDWITGHWIPRA